jgi:hypothetical protein
MSVNLNKIAPGPPTPVVRILDDEKQVRVLGRHPQKLMRDQCLIPDIFLYAFVEPALPLAAVVELMEVWGARDDATNGVIP